MPYTELEIKNRLEESPKFYNKECVNDSGKTLNGRYITEIIAEQLLLNDYYTQVMKNDLPNDKIIRKNFYFDNLSPKITNPEYKEEAFCAKLWIDSYTIDKRYRIIDKIIASKVNLVPNTNTNIDLIALNLKTIYIANVRGYKEDNNEVSDLDTLLKCMLEIEYQYQVLLRVQKEFFETFAGSDKKKLANMAGEIKKVIILPVSSKAWEEFQTIDNDDRRKLKELLKRLNITVLSYVTVGL